MIYLKHLFLFFFQILQFLFYLLFNFFICIFWFFLNIVSPLFPSLIPRRRIFSWICFSYLILVRLIFGISWRIEGEDTIPSKPCVIVSNHQSHWEAAAAAFLFPQSIPVLKKEIFSYPLIGMLLSFHSKHLLSINRKASLQSLFQFFQRGKNYVESGKQIFIFPEGTRKESLGKFHLGAFLLAKKCKVDLLPIVVLNSGHLFPSKKLQKKPGVIRVKIGKRISSESPQEAMKKVREWMESQLS